MVFTWHDLVVNTDITPSYKSPVLYDSESQQDKSWGMKLNCSVCHYSHAGLAKSAYMSLSLMAFQLKQEQGCTSD